MKPTLYAAILLLTTCLCRAEPLIGRNAYGIRGIAAPPSPQLWYASWTNWDGVVCRSDGGLSTGGVAQAGGWTTTNMSGNLAMFCTNSSVSTGIFSFYPDGLFSNAVSATLSMWMYRLADGTHRFWGTTINNSMLTGTGSGGNMPVVVAWTSSATLATAVIPQGQWTHLGIVFQEFGSGAVDTLQAYINGQQVTNITSYIGNPIPVSSTTRWIIDNRSRVTAMYDDIRFWTNALTVDEMRAVYRQGRQ